jgi:hypothetical protein
MAQLHKIGQHTNVVDVSYAQSRAKRPVFRLGFAALGAVAFWLPDVLIHVNGGPNLDSQHGWAITLVGPAAFLFAYVVARRFALRQEFNWPGATMLLGVWLTGGLFMTVAAMASGNEFIGATGLWRLVVVAFSVIPIVTYILASYDGSLFALLAVTMGSLLVCGIRSNYTLWKSAGTQSKTPFNSSESHPDGKAA